jgi:hypothetical protein
MAMTEDYHVVLGNGVAHIAIVVFYMDIVWDFVSFSNVIPWTKEIG